jgi:hypothetical protein
MSVESFTSDVPSSVRRARGGPGLVAAELLKLRKRRGLVLSSFGLSVVPMIIGYTVVTVQHASDPVKHGPGGGIENFVQSIDLLSGFVALVAILIGVTAGTGDLRAGVFRELVITGRSRLSLFAARVPGGLALLLPFAAAGFATAAAAAFVLAGGEPTPGLRLVVLSGAWIGLMGAVTFVLALGVSSVVGSTGPSIAILLGWQLILGPLVLGIDSLGVVRDLLPGAGVVALVPEELGTESALTLAPPAIAANLAFWTLAPLAAGAWRTSTRDA